MTDKQVEVLKKMVDGLNYDFVVDKEESEIIAFLHRKKGYCTREILPGGVHMIFRINQNGLEELKRLEDLEKQEAKEKAEKRKEHRFQILVAIINAITSGVIGAIIGVLSEHYVRIFDKIVSLFR